MPIHLSSFSASFHDYELDVDYYHGKDIVHQGNLLRIDPGYSWERINSKTRNQVRKAQKAGVDIRRVSGSEQDITDFRTVSFDPNDESLPDKLQDNEIMYMAYMNDTLVGGMILTPATDKVLYLHNLGSSGEGKKHNIATLLVWHGVEDLKDSQYKYIDVGVSFRPTLYKFFKQWKTETYPIIFTPPYILPDIRLAPYATASIPLYTHDVSKSVTSALEAYFGKEFTFLPRGLYAIKAVLQHIGITKDDSVAVFKTFDNDYISRCVSEPIEKLGNLTREIDDTTKAVFVIHEFGFPYKETKQLKKECEARGIPLIEDCAWSYSTQLDETTKIGEVGDYAIYSLPKILPIQYGAILRGITIPDEAIWTQYQMLDYFKREVVYQELAELLPTLDAAASARRENWQYLKALFEKDGLEVFAELENGTVPAVFLLQTDEFSEMFTRYERFGVEAGRYYQGNALFLPLHQNLNKSHLDYIYAVYRGYLNLCSNYSRSGK